MMLMLEPEKLKYRSWSCVSIEDSWKMLDVCAEMWHSLRKEMVLEERGLSIHAYVA
jgi:hypothetical protein